MDASDLMDSAIRAGRQAVRAYLAAEVGVSPDELLRPGARLVASPPGQRPYFKTRDAVLVGLQIDDALYVAATEAYRGFARAWVHHVSQPSEALRAEPLRWLRQNIGRGGVRLEVAEQYAVLADPAASPDPRVRRLREADEPVVRRAFDVPGREVADWLETGCYGGFEEGELACLARLIPLTAELAEVGVQTRPEFRGRGLATACVTAAVHELLQTRRAVLYTCATDNPASQAVARHLGAEAFGRLAYAFPD